MTMRKDTGGGGKKNDDDDEKGGRGEERPVGDVDPIRVTFVHLDLGIGGAEQLVLQLATASKNMHRGGDDDDGSSGGVGSSDEDGRRGRGRRRRHDVKIVTTRCDPDHCFASVKPPDGFLYDDLRVYGRWIPRNIPIPGRNGSFGQALCSTVRLLYLSYRVAVGVDDDGGHPDVIVLDVLPTPLPILRWLLPKTSFLYYCHFPDKLLAVAGGGKKKKDDDPSSSSSSPSSWSPRKWYRSLMDAAEEYTMSFSDLCVVNSRFTRSVVVETFPKLLDDARDTAAADDGDENEGAATTTTKEDDALPVLYPALDTSTLDKYAPPAAAGNNKDDDKNNKTTTIVSLNRYERKKNIDLAIHAMGYIAGRYPDVPLPRLIIAGGYDPDNQENMEYYDELRELASGYGLPGDRITFLRSISDEERTRLYCDATAVMYTPEGEHFGIVPLEAMYCRTPVIACNSGGPKETVLHKRTGYLCDRYVTGGNGGGGELPYVESFATSVMEIVRNPDATRVMGEDARRHVVETFGQERFRREWDGMISRAMRIGQTRREKGVAAGGTLLKVTFALVRLLALYLVVSKATQLWRGNAPGHGDDEASFAGAEDEL